MNHYKVQDKEMEAEQKTAKPKGGLKSILTGSFLSKQKLLQILPYVFFLTFLGVCYIANGYQAQKVFRDLSKTTNEIKELRSEYITTKSELMYISKQSQVARATAPFGLLELTSPPNKIVITKKEREEILND